jgi:V/A-type H+-transporting ATPase subunit K
MFEAFMDNLGVILALFGAALSVLLAGIGSARGVGTAGEAAAGVVSENPDVFGQTLVLELLPGTQGIYGFLIGFIVLLKTPLFGAAAMTISQGAMTFISCLPIALVGYYSAVLQGRVAASAIYMLGKRSDSGGQGIVMTVMVETYAVLALLASFLMVNGI